MSSDTRFYRLGLKNPEQIAGRMRKRLEFAEAAQDLSFCAAWQRAVASSYAAFWTEKSGWICVSPLARAPLALHMRGKAGYVSEY